MCAKRFVFHSGFQFILFYFFFILNFKIGILVTQSCFIRFIVQSPRFLGLWLESVPSTSAGFIGFYLVKREATHFQF
jgi:hypothetical protein